MPVSPAYRPDPRFPDLGPAFSDAVEPAAFPAAKLMRWDARAAARVGLGVLTTEEKSKHFADFAPLPENITPPRAMRYHGHQFRVYNPDIGDGRGFLFAQLRDERGRLLDLATKGSGQTPWSRTGDGRMTLQGGVREALIAAALEARGVPGCSILALFDTGERLDRYDEPSPARGGLMTRLQHSHVRIGSFQRHAFEDAPERVRALMEHAIACYFPDLAAEPETERAPAFLRAAVAANARLCAAWMAAGFVHGVLNSDNMTVTGESFDYGPSRFLAVYEPGFTAAYFDQGGIYAYARQPEATFWNLHRLAECLTLIADPDTLTPALNSFQDAYQPALGAAFARRLGVASRGPEADAALASTSLRFLHRSRLPFDALFFDWFGGIEAEAAQSGPREGAYRGADFEAFKAALSDRDPAPGVRRDPAFFSGDDIAALTLDRIRSVWSAIDEADDWAPFHAEIARQEATRDAYALSPPH